MAMSVFSTPRQAMATLAKYSQETMDKMIIASEKKYGEVFGPEGDKTGLNRPKTRCELLRLCAAVAGIEFCYAAETAFVSPILLRLHVPVSIMTFAWILSPILGLFLNPLFGSLSDRCRFKMGRRRPFILSLALLIVIGLIVVPYGQLIGQGFGDNCDPFGRGNVTLNSNGSFFGPNDTLFAKNESILDRFGYSHARLKVQYGAGGEFHDNVNFSNLNNESSGEGAEFTDQEKVCLAGIIVTIIGVMILDFSCDASQSHCRTYLLDVCIPADHSRGLSTFTVISGIGGFFGYVIGGIHWGSYVGQSTFMHHIRIVFGVAILLHLLCTLLTVSSFPEVQLSDLGNIEYSQPISLSAPGGKYRKFTNEDDEEMPIAANSYQQHKSYKTTTPVENGEILSDDCIVLRKTDENSVRQGENGVQGGVEMATDQTLEYSPVKEESKIHQMTPIQEQPNDISLTTYIKSIYHLPSSIFWLCLTNLFSWMSLLCYSLYFTDYVGQAVYGGDPREPEGTSSHDTYASGVRLGSLAMSLYSLSCSIYSLVIERLVKRFGARPVYAGGHLVSAIGTTIMALASSPVAVILCSPAIGVIYATLFTMPYILLAHYHDRNVFDDLLPKHPVMEIRGLGTDVALVSSMVFVGQVILSSFMGSLVHVTGSTVAVVWCSAILSTLGSLASMRVMYLDL